MNARFVSLSVAATMLLSIVLLAASLYALERQLIRLDQELKQTAESLERLQQIR